jgi:hypothetical protein
LEVTRIGYPSLVRIRCLLRIRFRRLLLVCIHGLLLVCFADVHSHVLQSICRCDPDRLITVRTYLSRAAHSVMCVSVGSHRLPLSVSLACRSFPSTGFWSYASLIAYITSYNICNVDDLTMRLVGFHGKCSTIKDRMWHVRLCPKTHMLIDISSNKSYVRAIFTLIRAASQRALSSACKCFQAAVIVSQIDLLSMVTLESFPTVAVASVSFPSFVSLMVAVVFV